LKSFVNKDMALADNVRKMQVKIRNIYSEIEKVARSQPVEVMPQVLAALSFIRQIYEHSLDIADLVA